MQLRSVFLLAMLSATSACMMGKNAAGWPVAKQPYGATVTVRTSSGSFTAELIEVTADGFVLKKSGKLVFAPFSIIDHLAAMKMESRYSMGRRMPPSPAARANLVTISHFPQGMTPEIRGKMLAASGQTELEVLR